MAEPLILDLSGRKGLAKKFAGDLNSTSANPSRRYSGAEGQFADGIFNPLVNYGYMSPANNTFATVSGAVNAHIISTQYDSINDDVYFAEDGTSIWHLDGLDDTSLTLDRAISYPNATLNDLETYELNGVPTLFYVYTSGTEVANFDMTTGFSASVNSISLGGRINPVASAEPVLTASERVTGSGSSTTISDSITVPSGSNQVGIAIVMTYNTTAPSSATWNGVAMSSSNSGSATIGATEFTFHIFRIIAPTTGTVTGTWGAGVTNRVMHAFVFDNAHQTTPYTLSSLEADTDTDITHNITISAVNQLPFTSVFSTAATHTFASGQVEITNATNNAGTDSSSYFSMAAIRVKVGTADLPFASADDDWLTSTVTGAFYQTVTTDNNFLVNADNGFSYVFAENAIHKIDGSIAGGETGSITQDVLVFPSYFSIADAVDTRGRMYIGVQANPISGDEDARTYSEGVAGVYMWDRQSTVVGVRDFIPLYGVRDIKKIYVEPGGDVRAICIGDDRFVQIRSISSGYGKIIKTLGISAYPEKRDGLKVVNNMTTWLGADGIFYLHGKLNEEETEELFKFGSMTSAATGAFTTGAIFVGHEESTQSRQGIIFSFEDTASDKVRRWYPHGQGTISSVAQTGNQGDVYSLVKYLPGLSKIQDIDLVMMPGGTAGSTTLATVKVYTNQTASSPASYTITQDDTLRGFKRLPLNKTNIHAIQMEIEWATGTTLGADDFHPAYASINYEPTTKKQ